MEEKRRLAAKRDAALTTRQWKEFRGAFIPAAREVFTAGMTACGFPRKKVLRMWRTEHSKALMEEFRTKA